MLAFDFLLQQGRWRQHYAADLRQPVTGLVGPSGSGKTTLLQALVGLRRPQQGWIEFQQQCWFDRERGIDVPSRQRQVGLVFQDNPLFPHLSVRQNLLYGYRLRTKQQRRFAPEAIIELLEIEQLLSRFPARLSGGERQRVGLGRAILASPQLLLLDEPLSGLDRPRRERILSFLCRIRDELQMPMILVSHDPEQIEQLTQHILTLTGGDQD